MITTPSFNGRTAHCRCANRGSIPLGVAMHPPKPWRRKIIQRVAQSARVSPSEGEGRWFNSNHADHLPSLSCEASA